MQMYFRISACISDVNRHESNILSWRLIICGTVSVKQKPLSQKDNNMI